MGGWVGEWVGGRRPYLTACIFSGSVHRMIGENEKVRKGVKTQRVVVFPSDGPGFKRERAEVSLIQKGLNEAAHERLFSATVL